MNKITESFDLNFKLVIIGEPSTGKTCLLKRYFNGVFGNTFPTLNIDLFTKSYIIDERNVILTAYDTAG